MDGLDSGLDMLMPPSSIYFINCMGDTSIEDITKEKDIDKLAKKYAEKRKWPKLQVALKNGNYFTLNNTQLHVFRKLEEKGQCRDIKVELVERRRVPEGILKMMTPPADQEDSTSTQYHAGKSTNGYSELQTGEKVESETKKDDGNNDADSMSSESLNSDVESVDSVHNDDYDLSWESSTDESTNSELEEEEESLI